MEKNIWIPFKIWNETEWFSDINKLIEDFNNKRKKVLINNFKNKKLKIKNNNR